MRFNVNERFKTSLAAQAHRAGDRQNRAHAADRPPPDREHYPDQQGEQPRAGIGKDQRQGEDSHAKWPVEKRKLNEETEGHHEGCTRRLAKEEAIRLVERPSIPIGMTVLYRADSLKTGWNVRGEVKQPVAMNNELRVELSDTCTSAEQRNIGEHPHCP